MKDYQISRGIQLTALSRDPEVLEQASRVVYKAIPVPLRWLAGRKRVHRLLRVISDEAVKIAPPSNSRTPGSHV